MTSKVSDRQIIKDSDIDPRHDWSRSINAHGVMNVDFEERVDFRRLHRYRLARTRQALGASELGALLTFDNNNIRYITSTAIGEWSRDKMARFALLAGDGEPHLWDFGSAAIHHRIYAPWLQPVCCHAGNVGLRGTIPPNQGLVKRAAQEIYDVLREQGVQNMPVGVDICEPPLLFELQKLGLEIRDGQQTMLDAREIRLLLWWMACIRTSTKLLNQVCGSLILLPWLINVSMKWDPMTSRQSMQLQENAAARIHTTSPIESSVLEIKLFLTSFRLTWATVLVTTAPSTWAELPMHKEMHIKKRGNGWIELSIVSGQQQVRTQ